MKKLFSLFLVLFFFAVTGSSVLAQSKIRCVNEPSTIRLESGDELQILNSTTGAITNMRTGNNVGSSSQNLLAANDIYFQSGFEEAWTFGAPSGWTSTPATDGNNTWHRTDFIGTWSSANSGQYSPVSFMGGASARFHTWSATAGTRGIMETPNINLSTATDSVFLSFWWTNSTGADTLSIYYSTNGGTNYTKLGYVMTTGGPWYRAYVALPNYNSATTKIKFEAYSDFGTTDIGLDEVIVYQKGSGYSGTASLPGTFTSFTDAARKLSLYGVSGPLTVNVAAGTYQDSLTFPSIPGTNSTNTITFVNSGGAVTVQRKGARVITGAATTGDRTDDAVISLWGADYITFDGINISNSSGATGTEWGYHVRNLIPNDGANNNTIKNCLIQMSKTNTNSRGIRHFAFWVISAQSGASSNNKYYNNDIQSCGLQGILLQGQGGGTYASFFDLNNEIGSVGGTARIFDIGGGTSNANGIALTGQNGAKVFGVQFDSIWATTGAVNALLLGTTTTIGDSTVNVEIYNNAFNRITQTSGTSSTILTAIRIPGQSYNIRAKIYNNFISNLKSNGTSANAIDAIYNQGNNNAGTKIEWYYNTIYLNNQLIGTNGASQVMRIDASTTANNLIIKNNIFVNKSVINGTGKNYIINRTGGTFTADNNVYYIDTTLANNYIGFYTSDRKGLVTWRTATSQDGSSAFENVTFINAATIPYDLHINTSVPTQIESGGTAIAGITTDIDGNTRNVSTPDIGADEGSFTLSSDVTPPAISYTLLSGTSSVSNRSFTNVSITDLSGVNVTSGTMPRCYYKKTTNANEFNNNGSGTDGWKYVEANGSSTPFDFTIDYSLLNGGVVAANDTIQYFVVAEDLAATPNVGINSGSFAATPASCNLDPTAFPIGGTINRYAIIGAPLSGTYTVGLSLMRTLTGKDLKYEARTRKVKVTVPDENALNWTNKEKEPNADVPNTSTAFEKEALNRPMKQIEVEETYYELTENGRKYDGPMYMEYPNGHTKSTNRPGSVNGGNTDLLNHYATITAAVNDLNGRGVSGAVTFLLVDNSYTEAGAIQFNNNISGISASNTVTIRPQTGVTATVSASVNNGGIFKILSNYITIDGSNSGGTDQSLTLQNTSTTTPSVVHIGSTGTTPITNVMVKNCIITNGANTGSAVVVADASVLTNSGYFNTITIQNNLIKKTYHGIYVNGGTTPQNGLNLFVTGNTISSPGADASTITGVYAQGVNGGTINQNDIGNMASTLTTTGSRSGIWLASGCTNITIERNKLHDLQYTGTGGYGANGVRISNNGTTSTGIVVKNNMIYNITGDADSYVTYGAVFSPVGILCYGSAQSGISIFNNSINLYGNTLNYGANSYSIGIALDDGSIADVRNNMISNTLGLLGGTGAGALCVALETSASQLSNSNYNCYYSNPSSGVKGLIKITTSGTNHLTMAALRTATGKDQLSFNSQPLFVSSTDLHIQSSDLTLNGRGTYIAGVNNDYDGDSRPTAQSTSVGPVDVGCDQYQEAPFGSYTANNCAFSGSGYYDGGLLAVEVVSGSITVNQVLQYPGVRTPNNTLFKNVNGTKQDVPVKNRKESEQNNNKSTKRDGTSGGQTDAMAVNVPWIYWELTDLTSPGASVRFYFNEEMLATIVEADLKLSFWDGSAWDNGIDQTVNTSGNYIELSLPGGFVWGSTALFAMADGNAPLPVVLSSFDAAVMKRDVSLSWTTESEINNQGFSVERRIKSQDNRYSDWKEVAFVEGKGNTTTRQSYSYSDKKLNSGTYQYRLKQVDFNGNYEYHSPSNNADLVIGKPGVFDIGQNYPNPSNPTSNIDFQMPFDGKVSLRVYDILGKEVATLVDGYRTADFYTAKFDGTNLSTGIYFYRIIAESGTEKFTKTLKMILVK